MKFSTAVVALAAVAAQAAAVREPVHSTVPVVYHKGVGYAGTPGAKGSHAKRAAEAVAEALANAEPKKKAKLQPGGTLSFCSVPGSSCNEKREIVDRIYDLASRAYGELDAREAEADAMAKKKAKLQPGGTLSFCSVPGSSCNEKREAEPKKKKAKLLPGGTLSFCSVPGSSCNEKREAEAEPKKKKKAQLQSGGTLSFCSVPGSSCNEKRGVTDLESYVRAIDPKHLRNECFAPGEACDTIHEAAAAFRVVHAREAEAAKMSPAQKLSNCGESHDCSVVAQAHLHAASTGDIAAAKAEKECHGKDGHCTLAARALDELADAINEGLLSIDEDF